MNITDTQLEKIFELAEVTVDSKDVTSEDVTKALIKIEEKLQSMSCDSDNAPVNAKVLIVDDLELSTYQLSTLLKKVNVKPVVAHSKVEAIAEIKKQRFDFLFIDLFLPDESDGLEVMSFANQYRLDKNADYKIIAISGTDDLDLVTDCFNSGVDEFVSKSTKWHEQILKIVANKKDFMVSRNFIRYDIDENTVTYNIKSLSKEEYANELCRNVNSAVLSGIKNVILNLENVQSMPAEFAKIFTELYKACLEAGGKFILLNPSSPVREVLDFACLNEILSVVDTSEDAFAIINNTH